MEAYLSVGRFLFGNLSLFLSLLSSLSRLASESSPLCQGQSPVQFPPVIASATLWGWVDLSVCLGEMNSVLATSGFSGALVPACAFVRATLAACRGCDFVDKVLYLGHLPGGREGKRSKGGIEGLTAPHTSLSPICLSPSSCCGWQ